MSEPWRTGRSLAEQDPAVNSSLILAESRTQRKDPLENFKPYTGGWNISNQHYWAVSSFLHSQNWVLLLAITLTLLFVLPFLVSSPLRMTW